MAPRKGPALATRSYTTSGDATLDDATTSAPRGYSAKLAPTPASNGLKIERARKMLRTSKVVEVARAVNQV